MTDDVEFESEFILVRTQSVVLLCKQICTANVEPALRREAIQNIMDKYKRIHHIMRNKLDQGDGSLSYILY